MVKSDAIVLHGKDSSEISVVSEGRSAPRVEMRSKLPIPPPFVVPSSTYTPEYPWIGQPRPAPKTWSWSSVSRFAWYVLVIGLSFGVLIYCGQYLVRSGKKPAASLHAEEVAAPLVQPGIVQEAETGVVSGTIIVSNSQDIAPTRSDLRPEELHDRGDPSFPDNAERPVSDVLAIPVPPALSQEMDDQESSLLHNLEDGAVSGLTIVPVSPGDVLRALGLPDQSDLLMQRREPVIEEHVIEISITVMLQNGSRAENAVEDSTETQVEAPTPQSTESREAWPLQEDDGGYMLLGGPVSNDAIVDKRPPSTEAKTNKMDETSKSGADERDDSPLPRSPGAVEEMLEATKTVSSVTNTNEDRNLVKSAALSSEMAEVASLPVPNASEDQNLLKSAGMISEVVEASYGKGSPIYGSQTEDTSALKSAGMTSEMFETQYLRGEFSDAPDVSLLKSAGMPSELAEAAGSASQVEKQDPIQLRSAGMTGEMAEAMALRGPRRGDHDMSLTRSAGLTSEMIEAAGPSRQSDGEPVNKLVSSAGVTGEIAEAVYSNMSPSEATPARRVSPKFAGQLAAMQDSSKDSGEQHPPEALESATVESTPAAAASTYPEEDAKVIEATALLQRLRDLIQRQKQLAERARALRSAQQESSSQNSKHHASAVKKLRNLARLQGELAEIMTIYREQLNELRALQEKCKELGLLGSTKSAEESEEGPERIALDTRYLPAEAYEFLAPPSEDVAPLSAESSAEAHDAPLRDTPYKAFSPKILEPQTTLVYEERPAARWKWQQHVQVKEPLPQHPQSQSLPEFQPQQTKIQLQQPQSHPQQLQSQPQQPQTMLVYEERPAARWKWQQHVQVKEHLPQHPQSQSLPEFQPQQPQSQPQQPQIQPQQPQIQPQQPQSQPQQPQSHPLLPLMEHVLEQRQAQRDAWQQEQRALAYMQLMDLYRQHHLQEQQVQEQEHLHQEAMQRVRQLAAHPEAGADSVKLLSDALGSPIAVFPSCPHCDLHHKHTGSRSLS